VGHKAHSALVKIASLDFGEIFNKASRRRALKMTIVEGRRKDCYPLLSIRKRLVQPISFPASQLLSSDTRHLESET
jgi:hypothetical protein